MISLRLSFRFRTASPDKAAFASSRLLSCNFKMPDQLSPLTPLTIFHSLLDRELVDPDILRLS